MQLVGISTTVIGRDFQVFVSASPLSISDDILQAIDKIWQSAIEQQGSKLFDNKILCTTGASAISGANIICTIVPYRYFYAQRKSSVIEDALQIKAVAVSGMVRHNDLVYFGRRSMSVTQYPGFFELIPSGSLDAELITAHGAADFRQQLIQELEEETGINASSVTSIEPQLLVLDQPESTWDICCQIKLLPTMTISNSTGLNEYNKIFSIPLSQIASFIDTNSGMLVPTSLVILQNLSI